MRLHQGIQKVESGLFLTHGLTLWGGSHIDCHIWRWLIVPSDLVQSFGAICSYHRHRVIHWAITYDVCVIKSMMGERQLTFNKIAWRVKLWKNSPPHATARWPPQQISLLNFLGYSISLSEKFFLTLVHSCVDSKINKIDWSFTLMIKIILYWLCGLSQTTFTT